MKNRILIILLFFNVIALPKSNGQFYDEFSGLIKNDSIEKRKEYRIRYAKLDSSKKEANLHTTVVLDRELNEITHCTTSGWKRSLKFDNNWNYVSCHERTSQGEENQYFVTYGSSGTPGKHQTFKIVLDDSSNVKELISESWFSFNRHGNCDTIFTKKSYKEQLRFTKTVRKIDKLGRIKQFVIYESNGDSLNYKKIVENVTKYYFFTKRMKKEMTHILQYEHPGIIKYKYQKGNLVRKDKYSGDNLDSSTYYTYKNNLLIKEKIVIKKPYMENEEIEERLYEYQFVDK